VRRGAHGYRRRWRPCRDRARKRGLYVEIAAEFAAEVEGLAALAAAQLGSSGEGLAAVKLTVRTAMIQFGA
jgi:hypothetical protein